MKVLYNNMYSYSNSVQDQKMEELVVQLDSYSRHGIPRLQHHVNQPLATQESIQQGDGQGVQEGGHG